MPVTDREEKLRVLEALVEHVASGPLRLGSRAE